MVKLHNKANFRRCKRDVVITTDTISFDSCGADSVLLIRDASNRAYPLRTEAKSPLGYHMRLKEK